MVYSHSSIGLVAFGHFEMCTSTCSKLEMWETGRSGRILEEVDVGTPSLQILAPPAALHGVRMLTYTGLHKPDSRYRTGVT